MLPPKRAKIYAVLAGVLLVFPSLMRAQTQIEPKTSESVREFVQNFYDWYASGVLKATRKGREFKWKTRASDLDPALLRALNEDEDAQAKVPEEVVGMDFDPFLSSQDPCVPYKVRDITQKGAHYFAEIDAECKDVLAERPTVTAEVAKKNGRWVFLNFHYPDPKPSGSDLLNILKELRDSRKQPSK